MRKIPVGGGRLSFQQLLAPGALAALYVFFCLVGENFFSWGALVNMLDSSYYVSYLAIGVTFAMISGGIDLSIGTVMMSAALMGGVAYNVWHVPMGLALGLCVLTGTGFGLLNGLLIAKIRIVPFVATLGVQMVASGLGAMVSRVMTMRYPQAGSPEGAFKQILFKTGAGFPMGLVWLLLFLGMAAVLLNKTLLGRYTFAMGSNEAAARLSGVNVDRWKMAVYGVVGTFAGLAGVAYAAAYTSIVPATGAGMEILGIAACVIGGTSLAGGVGSLSGTMIGVSIMAVLKQGLMSMGLQGHYQTFFTGILVIAAVALDIYRRKNLGR